MWFFSDIFWTNYETETGYEKLEWAIKDIVADELNKEEKLKEEYIEKKNNRITTYCFFIV